MTEGAGQGAGAARSLGEAGLILAVAFAAALAAWGLRTPRLPLAAARSVYEYELKQPLISAASALALYEAGSHLFVDTRSGAGAAAPGIPGALTIRPDHFGDDLQAAIDFLAPEEPIILYGDRLQAAAAVAGLLAERGYHELSLLDGGLAAWQAAGGPLRRGAGGGQ